MEKLVTKAPKVQDMQDFFDPPDERKEVLDWLGNDPESYMIVGYPGSGKSTLASTWPGIYFLNADNKMGGLPDEVKSRSKTFKHGDSVYEILMGILYTIGNNYETAKKSGIKTIVLDTLTAFCSYMEVELLADPILNHKGTEALQIQHYGIIANRVVEIIRVAKEVGINLVIIAHPDEIVNEEGDIILHPSMTGKKMEVKLPGMFDHVVFMRYTDESGFIAQLKPNQEFKHAKLSMGREAFTKAPKLVKDLTYKRLRSVIDGTVRTKNKEETK